jgi:hypothetical protein
MIPLQKALDRVPGMPSAMHILGMFADELMVPYFALLYWIFDKYKCVYGIWLVPVSEILNGCLKWSGLSGSAPLHFRRAVVPERIVAALRNAEFAVRIADMHIVRAIPGDARSAFVRKQVLQCTASRMGGWADRHQGFLLNRAHPHTHTPRCGVLFACLHWQGSWSHEYSFPSSHSQAPPTHPPTHTHPHPSALRAIHPSAAQLRRYPATVAPSALQTANPRLGIAVGAALHVSVSRASALAY